MDADNFSDEGFSEEGNISYASSIASEIRHGVYEYGRWYASYGKHFYGLPIDEDEQDRWDLQHCKVGLIYEGKLFLSPVREPRRVLDLACGSGTWAIDMADNYPATQVLGVDIAASQPSWMPSNCEFEIMDVESEWELNDARYDFIHARELMYSVRDWPELIRQAYEQLEPGGYFEVAGTLPDLGCDDGTRPHHSAFEQICEIFYEIGDAIGASGQAPKHWKQQFLNQGFEDVKQTVFKIPSNSWPKDKRLKDIGALECVNVLKYFSSGLERGYVEALGGKGEDIHELMGRAREEILNKRIHTYVFYYNVYGRKPDGHE